MHGLMEKAILAEPPQKSKPPLDSRAREFTPFYLAAAVLLLAFAKPIYDVLRLSWAESLHSHIPLIPFISAYVVWTRWSELPAPKRGSVLIAVAGVIIAAGFLVGQLFVPAAHPIEVLCLRLLGLLVLFVTAVATFLGPGFARAVAFPLAFLVFAVPLPPLLVDPLEIASQHASADAYAWLMELSGSTYFREGLHFALPGLNIVVAQECSGIRSSYVLFIVSLIAGNLFLTSGWRRLAMALFVFPLGIARNGFRIFTLSVLAVHWDKGVIDGPLHHRGGPI